jgi:hypothetical protein
MTDRKIYISAQRESTKEEGSLERRMCIRMQTFTRKDVQELKKQIEPIKKLALHDDADGITSAVLMSYACKIYKVWAPDDFGEWPIVPYKVPGQQEYELPPDVCVDMVPANPDWVGFCFDHHPGHPPEEKRKYKLVYADVPASLIIYTVFKDFIPQEQRWKVVVGAVGDGQPELVPTEIWREFPVLLEECISSWEKYGKVETVSYPLYMRLSSGINAACKLPEKWYVAYSVLRNAKSPWDLLSDPSLKAAKEFLDEERSKIYSETNPIQLRNGIRIWPFASETKIERTLAWELWEKDKKTTIAINTQTGRGSIRGTLATLIYEHLSANGFKASGHPGFGGLKLKSGQTWEDVYKCLTTLKI